MFPFNNVYTKWLPSVSLLLIFYAALISTRPEGLLIILIAGLLSAIPLIIAGLATALKRSGVSLLVFFKRPANIVTLIRTALVAAGLAAALIFQASGQFFSRLIAALLIAGGFSADFIDGYLSRRETYKPVTSLWGSWYDAESRTGPGRGALSRSTEARLDISRCKDILLGGVSGFRMRGPVV